MEMERKLLCKKQVKQAKPMQEQNFLLVPLVFLESVSVDFFLDCSMNDCVGEMGVMMMISGSRIRRAEDRSLRGIDLYIQLIILIFPLFCWLLILVPPRELQEC